MFNYLINVRRRKQSTKTYCFGLFLSDLSGQNIPCSPRRSDTISLDHFAETTVTKQLAKSLPGEWLPEPITPVLSPGLHLGLEEL